MEAFDRADGGGTDHRGRPTARRRRTSSSAFAVCRTRPLFRVPFSTWWLIRSHDRRKTPRSGAQRADMMAILPRAVGPLILIIGSADVSRSDYNPPLLNAAEAPGAAAKIGEALAKAGCRIVVFSSDPAYVEADVVRGFVNGSTKSARRQIQVRAPQGSPEATFQVAGAHSDIFDLHPDQDSHWVPPFYRAIRDADGVIIIGGGRSALIMGHLALAMGLPLLTPACFGGSARHVWAAIKPGDDLPTQEERNEMGQPDWRPEGCNAGRAPGRLRFRGSNGTVMGPGKRHRISLVSQRRAPVLLRRWGRTRRCRRRPGADSRIEGGRGLPQESSPISLTAPSPPGP
jgi:hypothetical protein